jgi:hypothetical protein
VTTKKIFDLDPGKLYFINKRVKLREKKYFLNLRKKATKVKNKNGGKVKLYFTLERKAAVQSIVPLHSYL